MSAEERGGGSMMCARCVVIVDRDRATLSSLIDLRVEECKIKGFFTFKDKFCRDLEEVSLKKAESCGILRFRESIKTAQTGANCKYYWP